MIRRTISTACLRLTFRISTARRRCGIGTFGYFLAGRIFVDGDFDDAGFATGSLDAADGVGVLAGHRQISGGLTFARAVPGVFGGPAP